MPSLERPSTGVVAVWTIFSPVTNPWSVKVIVLVVVLTPEEVKVFIPTKTLLL